MPLPGRTPLLYEGLPAESGEFDPHADWFKQPVTRTRARKTMQAIRARRHPDVVARIKAAGEEAGQAVRRTTRRRPPSESGEAPKKKTGPRSRWFSVESVESESGARKPAQSRTMPAMRATRVPPPKVVAKRKRPRTIEITSGSKNPLSDKQRMAKTDVLPALPPDPKALDKPRPRQVTRRLPKVKVEGLSRSPLLQELVTAGGVFATGLRPGSPLRSHPRDARDIPNPPRKSATTTANTGHTANTGAWVPDKKRRAIKIPKPKPIGSQYRAIEKDFEDQPSNTGGVLTLVRDRPKLLGG